jgi:hypothetical protein
MSPQDMKTCMLSRTARNNMYATVFKNFEQRKVTLTTIKIKHQET